MDYRAAIESCRYLNLIRIEEPEENTLRVIIQEARANEGVESTVAVGDVSFSNMNPIVSDESCRTWEISFRSYIAYSVRNESFAVLDDDEQKDGRLFCVYKRSKFIDYIRAATIVCENYPGPFQHYGLNCLNHTIDVISVVDPIIQEVDRL